jgi:hypothetical protein
MLAETGKRVFFFKKKKEAISLSAGGCVTSVEKCNVYVYAGLHISTA